MSKAEDLFGDDILFIPDDSKKSNKGSDWKRPLQEGEYFGHIVDVSTKDVEYSGYKANVYNFKVRFAEENKSLTFKFKDEEYSGSEYTDRVVRAMGVFKFLTPKEGDDFKANPSGNQRYLWFCKNMGIEVKKATRDIDGKKVTVEVMPNLSEDEIVGKPVIAVVGRGKPFTLKGKEIKPWEVKYVKQWEDGEVKDFSEEIPF